MVNVYNLHEEQTGQYVRGFQAFLGTGSSE